MFRSVHKVPNCFRSSIFNGSLIVSYKNEDRTGIVKLFDLATQDVVSERSFDPYLSSFLPYNDHSLLCVDVDNRGFFLGESLESITHVPTQLKIGSILSISDFLVVFQGRISNREFGVYFIPEKKVLWVDRQQKSLVIFDDKLFGQNDYALHRTDVQTGEIIWRQNLRLKFSDLSHEKGRAEFIGIFKNTLIICIEKVDKIIALDIETGEMIWEVETIAKGLTIDNDRGVLHQMMVNYAAYDLHTGALIDNYRDNGYFESVGIESQRSNFVRDGEYLITTDYRKGNIGAFNTRTHTFDWLHTEDGGVSYPAPAPMLYHAPYLLVQDHKDTLHIFEKE